MLLAATGAWLAAAYPTDPTLAEGAVRGASSGGWAQSVHAWSASVVLVIVILSLGGMWVAWGDKARPARRWWSTIAALVVLLGGLLTGGILRWDHHAWESYQHVAATAVALGAPDDPTGGSPDAPLRILFWLHVVAIPVGLVVVAVLRGKRPVDAAPTRERIAGGAIAASAVFLLSLVAPPLAGPAPVAGLLVSTPAWPFLWIVPFEAAWGTGPGVVVALILLLALGIGASWFAPHLRRTQRAVVLVGAVLCWGALTFLGVA